ncbi:putative UPF0481 protein At3g02645 [Cucurbita moschata]|uniref:UPF0481 protein At3g02645 n=1 Tax=Cucurbita moschata TaxID=3662 RepID=A0A6J1EBZ5_CUCMO|nr:putative UPF0481 protein At3g02645 [Cucurbita moschata]
MAFNSKELHKTPHETNWVVQINQLLDPNNLQTALQTPTSIFKLPNSITNSMPQAYFPRHIALGPYHHFQNELYQMELYKLDNAINAIESFKLPQLHQIAADLEQFDIKIRSCYNKFLDFGAEALAWIMLIDGLFLVQILAISNDENDELRRMRQDLYLPSPFPLFVEQKLYCSLIEANLMTQDELVNDILKLENQIPSFVLKKILPQNLSNNLHILFFRFCEVVSPKKLPPHDSPQFMRYSGYTDLYQILEQSHHLLHFLYLLILDSSLSIDRPVGMALLRGSFLVELLNALASVLQIAFLQQLSEAVGLIQSLLGLFRRVGSSSSSIGEDMNGPPLIPSAEQLRRVGVKLEGNYEDFHESISFEKERRETCLKFPTIVINAFSEVVYSNLVAFEGATKLNPPCFSNYVALMSGLITTIKDVKILKEASIIESHIGNEEEVVKLFDGLRSVLELKNMAEIQMVKDINSYYESCWKVKAKRFIQKYINPMLKVIVLVVVILLIGVVVVRTFCGWFGCLRILHVVSGVSKD